MKYEMEIIYCANGCAIRHFHPDFDFPGDPIDACNYLVKKILEERENRIDRSSILGARIYDEKRKLLLDVDYREKSLHLDISKKLNDFWIS
ncbi:hypothetical protein M0R72_05220 [Candidatus Pacearchaeota archaeon]|jgi:hypothetical protein|nr:hypothetical protein [Candidatus Pacearchaeota archaeon]